MDTSIYRPPLLGFSHQTQHAQAAAAVTHAMTLSAAFARSYCFHGLDLHQKRSFGSIRVQILPLLGGLVASQRGNPKEVERVACSQIHVDLPVKKRYNGLGHFMSIWHDQHCHF
eukprot:6192688-Pleurochrysis_carterae.AAC.1